MTAQTDTLRAPGPLEGARNPGGCDRCDAYQTVQLVAGGVWTISVYHDDNCPFLNGHSKSRRP